MDFGPLCAGTMPKGVPFGAGMGAPPHPESAQRFPVFGHGRGWRCVARIYSVLWKKSSSKKALGPLWGPLGGSGVVPHPMPCTGGSTPFFASVCKLALGPLWGPWRGSGAIPHPSHAWDAPRPSLCLAVCHVTVVTMPSESSNGLTRPRVSRFWRPFLSGGRLVVVGA